MDFNLINIDDRKISPADFPDAKGFIIVFTCNHCPYAIAYEHRLIELHNRFAPKGYPVIAINPNDASRYPQDAFGQMKVRAAQRAFPFPYLRDESQEVAQQYGAQRTPHVFLMQKDADGGLRKVYEGAIDDNYEDPGKVSEQYVANAVEALLAGKPVPVKETQPVGCSVKWKE